MVSLWTMYAILFVSSLYANRCYAYIVDSQYRPECPSVLCQNGGTLISATCVCSCQRGFGGFVCEKELKETKWPKDKYSLLSSVFGCPEEDDIYSWQKGYVNMSLPGDSKAQRWKLPYPPNPNQYEAITDDPNILGPYYLRSLQWNFCTRNDSVNDVTNGSVDSWPRGHYCVFRSGEKCPNGFNESQVTLSGYQLSWSDVDGTIPDITVNNTTGEPTFAYCCRGDEDTDVGDSTFPSLFPFILTKPNTSNCMEIPSMTVTEERFDLVDEFWQFVFDGQHSMFLTTDDGYQRLGLCFYTFEAYENCYYVQDGGFSYQGSTNVSTMGNSCVHWYDIPDDASVVTFKPHKQHVGDFDNNHCRTFTPDGHVIHRTSCFVNDTGHVILEACDIPICDVDDTLEVIGKFKPVYSVPEQSGDFATYAVDGGYFVPFVSDRPIQKAWLQVDLEETFEVHAVIIHRVFTWLPTNVRLLSVHISRDRWDFMNYGSLQCQNRRFPRKAGIFRFQCHRPIAGQYVTLRNFDDPNADTKIGNFFRLEIAELEVLVKRTQCSRRMGLLSGGIRDFQMGGSSEMRTNIYEDGRLYSAGAGWCSGNTGNVSLYFEVDMIVPVVVDGLEVQGSTDSTTEPVREFYVEYSVNDDHLYNYTTPNGLTKIFKTDPSEPIVMLTRYLFEKPFVARKIRIHIVKPESNVCLKFEVIGCPKRVTRDLYCRDNEATMFGYEVVTSTVYWIENIPMSNDSIDACLASCDAQPDCAGVLNSLVLCSFFTSSRYNPHFQHWYLTKAYDSNSGTFTKLCVKGVSDYTDCSRVIHEPTELLSPSYPLYYGTLLDCRWNIMFPKGTYVHIEVEDLHLPEPVPSTELRQRGYYATNVGSCTDKIQLGDLIIDHSNQQYYSRSVLVSSSNQMVIRLTSCARYAVADDMSGFKMMITQSEVPGCGLTSGGIESTCTSSTGILASPGFPTPFSTSSLFSWKIVGQPGQYILLTFKVLDIQSSDVECTESGVTVRDVARFETSQNWDPLIGRFCSLHQPDGPLKSSWETMEIDFKTESSFIATDRQGSGFMAEYTMIYQVQDFTDEPKEGCMDGWEAYNTSCYFLFYDISGLTWTWIEAEKYCNSYSGHLVSLQTRGETEFVHFLLTSRWSDRLNTSQDFYIGLRKIGEGGFFRDFEWSDGSPVTFTAWYHSSDPGTTQPDGLGNERCSLISLNSIHSITNWHDVPCAYDQITTFICERAMNSTNSEDTTTASIVQYKSIVRHHNMFYCESGDIINSVYMCDGTNDCIDGSDEICQNHEACSGYQFRCKDGGCIPGDLLCDLRHDCKDGSDEQMCAYTTCGSHEWKCTSGQCIPLNSRCDVKTDCLDRSDEIDCDTCQSTSFQCYDQTCTSQTRVCDSYYDCSGRFYEDEIQEDCESNSRLQSCASWYSIGRRTNGSYSVLLGTSGGVTVECQFIENLAGDVFADTIIHHQLETEIVHTSTDSTFDLTYKRPHKYSHCMYGEILNGRLLLSRRCFDTRPPSKKGSDMHILNLKETNDGCWQHVRFDCSYTTDVKIFWEGNNGNKRYNVKDHDDNCSCPYVGKCNGSGTCKCGFMNNTEWYGMDHGAYLTDEAFITEVDELPIRRFHLPDMISNFKPILKAQFGPLVCRYKIKSVQENSIVCGNGVLGPIDSLCKMQFDIYGDIIGCRDLSHLEMCEAMVCEAGYTKCPNSYCIWSGLVCDGVKHCPRGEDEMNCSSKAHCIDMYQCRHSDRCIPTMNVCDDVIDCPMSDDEFLCNVKSPDGCSLDKRTMTCNSLTSFSDNFFPEIYKLVADTRILKVKTSANLTYLELFTGLTHLDLASAGLTKIVPRQFSFAKNLIYLDLSSNSIIKIPANSFEGLDKVTFLNLKGNPLKQLEQNSFVGLSSIKELDLSGFSFRSLERGIFVGLDSLEKLNLSSNKIHGADDNTFEFLYGLTSLDLRQNDIEGFAKFLYYGLSSLEMLYVDSFTLCCIKPEYLSDDQCLSPKNELSSCSDLLRNNILSVSIWVIGIIAFLGNTVVLILKCVLDRKGMKKTYNVFVCNLSIADCLMGVYLIILGIADTMFRGEYTWNDFKWRNGVYCKLAGVISTIASEGSVIFLCLITLDRLLVVKFPFGNVRLSRSMSVTLSVVTWFVVLLLACMPLIGEAYYSWSFYSRSAVCLPLSLTRDRPLGYEYSVGLFVVFNFIAFLLIATAQIVIYLAISSTRNSVTSKGRRVDIIVARKLFFVAITDFMCWFPIGLMGIMALNGEVISGEVYAWIAVFVLPINSALNPFLYTLGTSITTMINNVNRKLSRTQSSMRESSTKSVRDVVGSDLFVFGKFDARDRRKMTLQRYIGMKTLTTMDVYRIARAVCKALEMLHSTEMVHGKITTENIMITLSNRKKMNRVMLRSSPVVCMDEEDFKKDIEGFGRMLRGLVRLVEKH